MAKNVEVGIHLIANTKNLKKGLGVAKKGFKGLRKSLELTGRGAEKFGSSYKSGIDTVFKSVEVFKSIQGLLTDTVGRFLEASAKFRFAADSQLQAISRFKRLSEQTLGAFGDIFTAMTAGIADALSPALKSLKLFIQANRELIGTKIVEFLAGTAHVLLNVLAPAVNYAYKIFSGFKNIVSLTEAAVAGYTSTLADLHATIANEEAVSAYQKLAKQEQIVMDLRQKKRKQSEVARAADRKDRVAEIMVVSEIGVELDRAIKKQEELRFAYEKTSANRDQAQSSAKAASEASQRAQAAASREILQQEQNMKDLEAVINRVQLALGKGIDKATKAAFKRLREEVQVSAKTQEERDKLAEAALKKKEAADKLAADRAKKLRDAALAAEKQRVAELQSLAMAAGSAIINNIGTALGEVEAGTKSAKDAFQDMAKSIIKELIKIAAQKALIAIVQMIGAAAGGPAGIAVGVGASVAGGVISAAGKNSGGYVKGYASGGGVDSVRAMLTPGEYVLPKGLVDNIRLGKAPAKAQYANGGMVPGPASAFSGMVDGPPVNIQMQTFAVPSRGEFRRWYKNTVNPSVLALWKRGQLR